MGVPRLFPWLVRSFPDAVKHFRQGEYFHKVAYLYLDANGLLHAAAQEVFNYGAKKRFLDRYASFSFEEKMKKTFSLFFENIVQISQIVSPTKVLYIAIDGPAPLAKQAQQRQRRFVAAQTRIDEEKGGKSERFDSNSITPGTVFMHRLTQYLNYAIRKEMNMYPGWKNIRVIFSPPTVAGEGEHKIMDYIRTLSDRELKEEQHCLFGPDGDLIMLTLASHIPHMWLFREDQFNPGFLDLIDIGMVREGLAVVLRQMGGIDRQIRTLNDVTDDFIIEGFFVGNDFLPKIQMFHFLEDGLEFMLGTYGETSNCGSSHFLTVDSHFNIRGFKVFIKQLAKYESTFLIDQIAKSKTPSGTKFQNKTLEDCITKKISNGRLEMILDMPKYRQKYYTEKLHLPSDLDSELRELCRDYFRSLVWVFEYYVHGLPSWRWAYRHHYAPLMIDFNDYIQSITDAEAKELASFKLQGPSLPFEQLLSVLPLNSVELLPSQYHCLVKNSNSRLVTEGYYPSHFETDYEGKLKEYQGIALLPFVDYDIVHQSYQRVTKKYHHTYTRNTPGHDIVFQYDPTYSARFVSRMGIIDHLQIRKSEIQHN